MVLKAKSTRNADLRHAQSIARQRQATRMAATNASPEDLPLISHPTMKGPSWQPQSPSRR